MKKFFQPALTAIFVVAFMISSVAHAEDAETYYNRGVDYYNQKQYESAIQCYTKAIELNPNFAMAYNNRGAVYNELKQYERAIQDYDKAIELNPNLATAYTNCGTAYF